MAGSEPRIVADTFERDGGVVDELFDRRVHVIVQRLTVADYDLGHGVLVERKTIADLHLSLQCGRLWRQIGALRASARWPCLLVEGPALDDRATSPEAIRGACLAILGQGVAIIRSDNAADSATWLRLLALRAGGERIPRDRPVYAQRLKPARELVGEAMLAAVPGISVVCARRLLVRFGTVSAVVAAGYDEWLRTPGIGPARANSLRRAIS